MIVLEPYDELDRLEPAMEDDLWRLVQAGFRERRKMLRNVLRRQLTGVAPERIEGALDEVAITSDRRPQTLAVGEWIRLLEALGPLPPPRP